MATDLADFNPKQPGDLAQVPERVRLGMAQRGRMETYYLTYVIMGYDKLTPRTHGPLCTFLDTCDTKRRLIQMPRSHFKTTCVTVAHRIKEIINNPFRRILIVGDTLPNARKHLTKIKLQFTSNALFRWLYPEVCWEDTSLAPAWSQDQIFIPHKGQVAPHGEPTIDVIGAGGAVVSRHYDTVNADDLIGESESYSAIEMDRVIDWFTGLESLFVPPVDDGLMDIPSTFWRTDDVYAFAESYFGRGKEKIETGPFSYLRGDIAVFRRGAIENGVPIFPEAVSLNFLARLQEKNPERYAAQYANNPFASGVAFFRPEYKRFYDVLRDGDTREEFVGEYKDPNTGIIQLLYPRDFYIVSMCDPHAGGSAGKRFRGGRAAVITTGVRNLGNHTQIVLFDCWIRRAPTNVIIDELFRQNAKWGPNVFSIEANGLQKMLKYWIDERTERDNLISIPYKPFIPRGEKIGELRIKGLQPPWRQGNILARRDFFELWEEYDAFPRGTMDGLDALSQGLEEWGIGFGDEATDEELNDYERAMREMRNVATGY